MLCCAAGSRELYLFVYCDMLVARNRAQVLPCVAVVGFYVFIGCSGFSFHLTGRELPAESILTLRYTFSISAVIAHLCVMNRVVIKIQLILVTLHFLENNTQIKHCSIKTRLADP